MLRTLDLFSGIGGFSLGLERTGGFKTVAFCEIEPFCRRVLAKHWPAVPIFDDVRTLKGSDVEAIDVICGGFPCQDISVAGRGAGLAGERSGLWGEYRRLVGEIRPRYVIVENVAALLGRGFSDVLGDLAALGYDAEWHCIPASAVGAPHQRDRLWALAYTSDNGHGPDDRSCEDRSATREAQGARHQRERLRDESGRGGPLVAYAHNTGCFQQWAAVADATEQSAAERSGWWSSEPDVGRVAHGVPARVDRLRGLGNAVVPQIPELIGRAILEAEGLASVSPGVSEAVK